MDAGKYGVVVADVEGVELQKEWTVGEATSAVDGPRGPRAPFRFRRARPARIPRRTHSTPGPTSTSTYARPSATPRAMVSLSLAQQPVDFRPALTLDRHRSVEFPITITGHRTREEDEDCGLKRDDAYFNVHLHGVVGCYKFENSDWEKIRDAAKRVVGRDKDK